MTFITAKRGGETDEKSSGKNDTGNFVSAPDMAYLCSRRPGDRDLAYVRFVSVPAVRINFETFFRARNQPREFGFCLQCFLPAGRLRKPD